MNAKSVLILALVLCAGALIASGQIWTPTGAPRMAWTSLTTSADGNRLEAIDGTSLYISTNAGITWSLTSATAFSWSAIASSADGAKLTSVGSGRIYASTNFGATWHYIPAGAPGSWSWTTVASSADGATLVVGNGANQIAASTNSGSSWTFAASAGAKNIVCSADGSLMTALYNFSVSTNSGKSWGYPRTPGNNPGWGMTASSSGKIMIVWFDGGPYLSTNQGNTWSNIRVNLPANPNFLRQPFAISADGSKMLILTGSTNIYVSSDFGVTWATNGLSFTNNGIIVSADGNKLFAIGSYDQNGNANIYSAYTTPTPKLNLCPANGQLVLSWIIPSTNFLVQQKNDLTTTNWTTLTNKPALNFTNLQNVVVLPVPSGSAFYRLGVP